MQDGSSAPLDAAPNSAIARMTQVQRAQRAVLVAPAGSACVSQVLVAHPSAPTFLSGSAPGYAHLWRFGTGTLKATYAPLPYSRHLFSGGAAAASGAPQPTQVAHWGYLTDAAFCASGERFVGVGKGGWVAIWRHDARWAATPHGVIGCCDWSAHCMAKRGEAVAFVGPSATVFLVAGAGGAHRDVALWDVLSPVAKACVGSIACARHVSDFAIAADDVTVVTVNKHGDVAAFDLRMLGPDTVSSPSDSAAATPGRPPAAAIWHAERAHSGGASCVVAASARDCRARFGGTPVVATGGHDGAVMLWDVRSGARLQVLEKLHSVQSRSMFGFGATEERAPCKVKAVAFHAAGIVSVGHNISVLLTPWSVT